MKTTNLLYKKKTPHMYSYTHTNIETRVIWSNLKQTQKNEKRERMKLKYLDNHLGVGVEIWV